MLGCCAFKRVLISRKDVIGNPSFSLSIFSFFNATISPWNKTNLRIVYIVAPIQEAPQHKTIGSFSNEDGDGNQDVKKAIGLLRKTTTLHVHHAFLYISLPSLHDYDVMPNCKFYSSARESQTKGLERGWKQRARLFFLSPHTPYGRACEARALRARKTLTLRFTDFFTDFEKKTRLFGSVAQQCWGLLCPFASTNQISFGAETSFWGKT